VQNVVPILVHGHQSGSRFGNKLLQYALARKISQDLLMETSFFGFKLDFLSVLCSYREAPRLENPLFLGRFQCNSVEFTWLRSVYTEGSHDGIVIQGWGTRFENLLPLRKEILSALNSLNLPCVRIDSAQILVSTRMAETLDPVHPDYGPLPFSFYSAILNRTGLAPVFGGQLTESWYLRELKAKFGEANFLDLEGPLAFETLRRAENKIASVSTFSWIASWLGSSTSKVHMPLSGAFNRLQRPDWNLAPWSDARFHFYWLKPMKRTEQPLVDYLGALEYCSLGYPEIQRGDSSMGRLKMRWLNVVGNVLKFLRTRGPGWGQIGSRQSPV
jgi:hypothetical protein